MKHAILGHRWLDPLRGEGMRAKALRGSGWTFAGYGLSQAIRLGSSLILTRLLVPEAYGVMSIAMVFMVGLQMLSDLGIRPAIIQSPRGLEPDFLNTAWTLQAIRGILLWIGACAIAYPASIFYAEPILFPILCVIGASAAISGFQTTAFATANKQLRLGRVTMIELITQVITAMATIIWALVEPTVWALAGGIVMGQAVRLGLGFRMLESHRHRFFWDRTVGKELISFGIWIFLSSMLGFLANQGDRLVLGRMLDMEDLGQYALALNLAMLPHILNSQLGDRVLLAVYAERRGDHASETRKQVARIRRGICGLLLPFICLLIVFGQEIIELLYDPRYAGAGWKLQVISVGYGWSIATSIGPFLLSLGRSKLFMLTVLAKTLSMVGCMAIGGALGGSTGVIIGVAAGPIVYYPVDAMIYRRFGLWIWKLDLAFTCPIIGAALVALTR